MKPAALLANSARGTRHSCADTDAAQPRRERSSGEVRVQASDVTVLSADGTMLERAQAFVEAHMGERDFEVAQVADEVGLMLLWAELLGLR